MDKRIKFFKVFSLTRCICIILLFIIEKLWQSSISDSGPFSGMDMDIHIDFTFWELLAIYSTLFVIPINTIIALLLSFKPRAITNSFLNDKYLLGILYWIELIILPFFTLTVFQKIDDNFFPKRDSFIGTLLRPFFAQKTSGIDFEKLMTINMSIVCFCCLLYIILFYPVLSVRRAASLRQDNIISS